MAIYYIDSREGKRENDGLSACFPKDSYRSVALLPGDTLLFKAGSVFRDTLDLPNGAEGELITVDMYGIGKKPEFWGSVDITDANDWVETEKNIWKYTGSFFNEPCNLVFNFDHCGVLAWEYQDMDAQGRWFYTHLGYDRYDRTMPEELKDKEKALYLYSEKNPGEYYTSIECPLYYKRIMVNASKYISINNICVKYGGCHGFASVEGVKCLELKNCEFRFIGGAVWDVETRVRFGNGAEIWEYGEDFLVENCYFEEIYDSCTTQQGMRHGRSSKNIVMRNNIFKNYGMAAYELRDEIVINTYFENNICIGAGLGFSLQGETPPRKSEIWPQPMGHHIFVWRIKEPADGGSLFVRNNVFHECPYGAAVYSISESKEAEDQMIFENNVYYSSAGDETLLLRINGINYSCGEFEKYQIESGNERGGRFEKVFLL